MEKTQRQRFFATFFNANAEIVRNLNIPKARGAGEFVASYSEFSLNTSIGSAEGVIEFDEQVWSNRLEEHLAMQGAACITIITFACNDNNQSAGAALARVWKSAKKPGFSLITRGQCNVRLLAKANEISMGDGAKTMCMHCRACVMRVSDDFEYDVVKKRRLMDEASVSDIEGSSDDSKDALEMFEEFSSAVMCALYNVAENEKEILRSEKVWMEQTSSSSCKKRVGFVYAAWNELFPGLIKIGATMRDTPFKRIKELSGTNVPKSFELVACVPSIAPFALETKVHKTLKKLRVKKDGEYTEFFKMSKEMASDHLSSLLSE